VAEARLSDRSLRALTMMNMIELLIEEAEDRLDVEAARQALTESDERIQYEEFRRQQGLHNEPKAKKRHSTTAAGTKTN
jgi:hypothetical protein